MILGAVAAIGQTNIKRLIAYSSIGHMGYALAGVSTGYCQQVIIASITYIVNLCSNESWNFCMYFFNEKRW